MPVERTASCHVANTLFSTLQLIWLILRLRMPKVILFFWQKAPEVIGLTSGARKKTGEKDPKKDWEEFN